MDYICGWVEDRASALDTAYTLAQRAVLLDEADCRARWLLGNIHIYRREYDEACAHLRRAIALNPNDVDARGMYGLYLIAVGETEAALEQFDIARRHNPFEFNYIIWYRGIALFTARRYEEAISHAEAGAQSQQRGSMLACGKLRRGRPSAGGTRDARGIPGRG